MLAIAESTPGAIGINMATYAGFKTTGVVGSVIATVGLVTPAIIMILIIARCLKAFRDNPYVESVFHCLRPASVALIAAAGLNVAKMCFVDLEGYNLSHQIWDLGKWTALIFGVILFITARKTKVHPIILIIISAVVGVIFKLGGV